MPLFSIIVPCYNASSTIERCLSSIGEQSADYEVIVVDDGSMDVNGDILDSVYSWCKQVLLVHQDNSGVSAARNAGLECVTGKWVLFCDSDDSLNHGALSHLSQCLAIDPSPDGVIFGYTKDSKTTVSDTIDFADTPVADCKEIPYVVWRMVFKKSVLDKLQLRFTAGIRYAEDQEFLLKYLLHCQNIRWITEKYYCYTPSEFSAMSRLRNEAALMGIQDHWTVLHNLCEYFSKDRNCPDWYRKRLNQLIKSTIMVLYRAAERASLYTTFKRGLKVLLTKYPQFLAKQQFCLALHFTRVYLLMLFLSLKLRRVE